MNEEIHSAPVLFLIFNRPDTTKIVFESIRSARPKKLYIASDGPRLNKDGEAEKVELVKKIVANVDWECEVKTLYREVNLGCKDAVSQAITWFFKNEENGIILEDDCLPDPTFFDYCSYLLEKYKNDNRVMSICGTNLSETNDINYSYYFAPIPHIWGWATWRRVWQDYDVNLSKLEEFKSDVMQRDHFSPAEWRHWVEFLDSVKSGRVNTWDVQFTFLSMITNTVSIFPKNNLIANIGFGADATHTTRDSHLANLKTSSIGHPLKHPPFVTSFLRAAKERNKLEGVGVPRVIRGIKFIITPYGMRYCIKKIFKI